MPKNYTEESAIREVMNWGLGIEFSKTTKIITIPKDAVIGLRRLGLIDFLKKCDWLMMRVKK